MVGMPDGNLIYDNTYATYGIQDNKEGNLKLGEGWNLLYMDSFGGDAVATVETVNDTPFAKITVKDPGNQDYSIQMLQYTLLGRGRTYKLSFDVKAEEDRNIQFKVGVGETRGYAVYLEEIESEPVVEDFNKAKEPLENGSLIYNVTFDKGKLDRLTYWNLEAKNGGSATMNVPEPTRDLHIRIHQGGANLGDVTLDQRGLKLGEDGQTSLCRRNSSFKNRGTEI